MREKVKQLKKLWEKHENTWNGNKQMEDFQAKYSINKLEEIPLKEYTNIKTNDSVEYFTNWLERKTDNCGSFRTGSSYAYGIYRVNPNNIQDENDKQNAKYKIHDKNYKMNKDLINEEDAEDYFVKDIRPIIIALAKFENIDVKNESVKTIRPLDINYARKIAYMYNYDKLIPIYKREVIESIASFLGIEDEIDFSSYKATRPIFNKLKEEFGIQEPISIETSQKMASFLWENFGKSVSFDSKNIIYYGAPGTGKTYTVQNTVKQRVLQSDNSLEEVVLFTQFHPSVGYEDFIEGLKPYINDRATGLKLTNGIFKKFCKKAMDTLKDERMNNKKDSELTYFYFVADEINRAELSTVFGELLLCLEESKRVDFNKDGSLTDDSITIKTQYSYLYSRDEDRIFEDNNTFGVPSNLFFIGTMNDIDRSIDSFDLALRRRFIWERMDCDYDVIANSESLKGIDDLESYINICKNINNYIAKTLSLGKSYEIGHSYFMDIHVNQNKISKKSVQNLFDKKIKPLIEEYLRGEYNQVEIEEKLKEAHKIFSL